jgi:hypothetical protein
MEKKNDLAVKYADSFRLKVDDAGWHEQKKRDFIAGYESAIKTHDGIKPELFYVVANNSEEGLEQITNGLKNYQDAKTYMDSDFCKKRWANAFIVCTVKELT